MIIKKAKIIYNDLTRFGNAQFEGWNLEPIESRLHAILKRSEKKCNIYKLLWFSQPARNPSLHCLILKKTLVIKLVSLINLKL